MGEGKVKELHCSVFLKVNKTLKRRITENTRNMATIPVTIGDIFVSHLDRVADDNVFCVGVVLQSPELLTLKERCLEGFSDSDRRTHDPYGYKGNAGHISLLYFKAEYEEQVKQIVSDMTASAVGNTLQIHELKFK